MNELRSLVPPSSAPSEPPAPDCVGDQLAARPYLFADLAAPLFGASGPCRSSGLASFVLSIGALSFPLRTTTRRQRRTRFSVAAAAASGSTPPTRQVPKRVP